MTQLQQLSNQGQPCFLSNPTNSKLPLCYYEAAIKYYPPIGISTLIFKEHDALKKQNHRKHYYPSNINIFLILSNIK